MPCDHCVTVVGWVSVGQPVIKGFSGLPGLLLRMGDHRLFYQ